MNEKRQQLIEKIYADFNNRDIDAVFTAMVPDVEWPNSWESGYLIGYDEIRDYWKRQWAAINPTVIPVGFRTLPNDRLEVEVLQTALDLSGNLLFEGKVKHVYEFEGDLIKSMEIENEQ